jgi:hypothetical protein
LLLDHHLHQKRADLAMSNTANPQAFQAHTQLGANRVPVGSWDQMPLWITNYSALNYWLARRNICAARLLSYPVGIGLSLKDMWNRNLVARRAHSNAKLELCTSFDDRFNEFWNQLRLRYPQKLLVVRTQATLKWHFNFALREKRIWIITLSEGARLQAYAIFMLQRNRPGDPVKRLHLADFQSLDGEDAFYFAILDFALKQSRKSGIHSLSTIGFSASGTDTSTLAPYRKAEASWKFLYKTNDVHLAKALADPKVWCPSLYDGEASIL